MDDVDSASPQGVLPQSHWYDTWDRQVSQSFSSTAKGLRNAPGENNCFLNSAVQVFWHIDVFRRSYRRLSGHLCMGNSCIFCALKVIFTQFQYSDQSSLQPNALRKALANTFAKQERFQLGHMDDAAECFENILRRIHFHIASDHNEDTCNAPHCVAHQKFAMTVFDQLVCPCGASSEPLKFHEIVHYISANALVSQSRTMQESGDVLHPNRFGLLLRNAGAVGDIRDCPQNCGKKVQIRRTLLNVPDVVSIGLVWGSDRPDMELTTEVAQTIGTTLLLPDIFHSVMCSDGNMLPRLQLTAMVCYYGKHYSTFIWHTKINSWIYFDDATVKEIGPRWEHVVDKCVRGRYQPLLLIYCNPAAVPVPTETAPSTRVMAPGYSVKGNTEGDSARSDTPREPDLGGRIRSTTPNLEGGDPNSAVDRRQTPTTPDSDREILSRKSSFEHRRQSSFLIAVSSKPNIRDRNVQSAENSSYVNGSLNSHKEEGYGEPVSRNNSVKSVNGHMYNGEYQNGADSGQDMTDSYNYTLSTSDQYRRPMLSNSDSSKFQIAQNFSRANDVQKKESFKRGKGKVAGDVIRFQMDPSRRPSSSSDSSEPSSSPTYPDSTMGHDPVTHNKPALPSHHKSQLSRSQSCDDHQAGHGGDSNNNPHRVVKPQPSNPTVYENMEEMGRSHTPVQSGLATLPRKKTSNSKQGSQKDRTQRSSSINDSSITMAAKPQFCNYPNQQDGHEMSYNMPAGVEADLHSRQSSNSSILSQSTVVECPQNDSKSSENSKHSRQASSVSQDGSSEKPKESKSKSGKRTKLKREKNSQSSGKPPLGPDKTSVDEGFSENSSSKYYIDSKMVESVLNFQKLQRSGSVVSQASTSSVESDSFHVRGRATTPKDNLSVEIPFDTMSLESHKDSGYGSSDRNSSSSTGSITMNPYEQYFMSRSMIPPKTINPQVMAENMRKLMGPGGHMGLEYTQEKDLKSLVTNPTESYPNVYTVQHCQQVPSSHNEPHHSRDLKNLPKEERSQHISDALNKRCKPVPPPQVPNKPQQFQQQKQGPIKPVYPGQDGRNGHPASRMGPTSLPQGAPPPYSEHAGRGTSHQVNQSEQNSPTAIAQGNEQFIGLCQKAEDFMDQCVLAETSEEFGQALHYCQLATDQLKGAMRLPNISGQSYDFANRKSNSCLLKLRSLQKRLMSRQESNTSSNSSDSSSNHDYRNMKGPGTPRGQSLRPPSQQYLQPPNSGPRPPSRSSSQNSVDSLKDGSTSSGSGRSGTPVHMLGNGLPPRPQMDRSFETNTQEQTNSADIYGTLPRRQTQKSQDHTRMCNNPARESEVYQSFLEKQKQNNSGSQVCHSRSSSGALTPVNMLDSNYPNGDRPEYPEQNMRQQVNSQTVKTGHADIRQISQNSIVNRQSAAQNSSTGPQVSQSYKVSPGQVEVGSRSRPVPVPPVKPAWLQPGNQGYLHGNVVVSKLPVASGSATSCIQTACSASVSSVVIGQCTPVDTAFNGGSLQRPSHRPRQIERSASFSHTKPNHTAACLTLQARQPDVTRNKFNTAVSTGWPVLSSRNVASQPDLRNLVMEEHGSNSRPHTPQTLPPSDSNTDTDFRPSVRDLASKFETPGSRTENVSNVNTGVSSDRDRSRSSSCVSLNRQRSKSESEFLAPKPKSALSKKGKKSGNKPRKSVTFSANICLVAAMDSLDDILGGEACENQGGYQSDEEDMAYHRNAAEDNDDSSGSTDSPVEVSGEGACSLCHKKGVELGRNYCSKCEFYMSRFMPSR